MSDTVTAVPSIWSDLDSTLNSLDVITSRLAGMQSSSSQADWAPSLSSGSGSSPEVWYDGDLTIATNQLPQDLMPLTVSPRSARSEKRSSLSSQSSSLGYHSANHDNNGALLSPLSDQSKWTVSSPKAKVHFDEFNLVLTKSPTSHELSTSPVFRYMETEPKPQNHSSTSRGLPRSKTTIPVSTGSHARATGRTGE